MKMKKLEVVVVVEKMHDHDDVDSLKHASYKLS